MTDRFMISQSLSVYLLCFIILFLSLFITHLCMPEISYNTTKPPDSFCQKYQLLVILPHPTHSREVIKCLSLCIRNLDKTQKIIILEHAAHRWLNVLMIAQQIFLAVLYSVLGLTVGCNMFGQLQ